MLISLVLCGVVLSSGHPIEEMALSEYDEFHTPPPVMSSATPDESQVTPTPNLVRSLIKKHVTIDLSDPDSWMNSIPFIDAQTEIKLRNSSDDHIKTFVDALEQAGMLQIVKSISIRGCSLLLTDDGLIQLARLTGLTSLSLRGCEQITDAGLRQILPYLTNLTSLDLFGCRLITNSGLRDIAPSLTHLTSLDLAWCFEITAEGLGQIVLSLANLKSLGLAWCFKITAEGLGQIVPSLTNLMSLDLRGCRQITEAGINRLQQARADAGLPRLKILR